MQTTTATGRLWDTTAVLCRVPGIGYFSTRLRRRGLVIGFGAMLVALLTLGWLDAGDWTVLVSLVPFLLMAVYLAAATRAIMDRPYDLLDEHERHLRHTVLRNPYLIGAILGLAGGAVAATAGQEPGGGSAITLAVLGAVFSVPSLLLAWQLPDVADDLTS